MAKTFFTFDSTSHTALVQPERIFCKDNYVPTLVIPIELELNLLRKNTKYVLLNGEFILRVDSGKILAKSSASIYKDVTSNSTNVYLYVEFEIDEDRLHTIERNRTEGVSLKIDSNFNLGIYEDVYLGNYENGSPIIKTFVNRHYSTDSHNYLDIKIPQSQWVNDILPKLGNKQYRLIELPVFNEVIPDSFKKSIKELEEATKYFKQCDWDKVVAHCRSAIDPIKNELPNIKTAVESDSEFKWFKTLNEKTFDWLDTCIRSTNSVSSKTHHSPSTGHFSRIEAQIIFMTTTSLVAYAGHLKS